MGFCGAFKMLTDDSCSAVSGCGNCSHHQIIRSRVYIQFVTMGKVASNVAHRGAVSWTRLLLVDFLIGVGCVEPAGPLLLLALGKRMLPQSRVNSIVIKFVERRGGSGQLHISSCSGSLQKQREAVGVACTIALGGNGRQISEGVNTTQYCTGNGTALYLVLMQTAYFIELLYIKSLPFANHRKALTVVDCRDNISEQNWCVDRISSEVTLNSQL